jgi:hypothetical protein
MFSDKWNARTRVSDKKLNLALRVQVRGSVPVKALRKLVADGLTFLNVCFHRSLCARAMNMQYKTLNTSVYMGGGGVLGKLEASKVSASKRVVLLVRLTDKHAVVCARALD